MHIQQNNFFKLAFGILGVIGFTFERLQHGSGSCLPNDNGSGSNPLNVNLQLDYIGTVPVLNGIATSPVILCS